VRNTLVLKFKELSISIRFFVICKSFKLALSSHLARTSLLLVALIFLTCEVWTESLRICI
jgi:hypothetical protein